MERDDLCKSSSPCNMSGTTSILSPISSRVTATVDIYLAYVSDLAIPGGVLRDEIDRITEFNPVTGTRQNVVKHASPSSRPAITHRQCR